MALIDSGAAGREAEGQAQGAAVTLQQGPTVLGPSHALGGRPSWWGAPATPAGDAGDQAGLPLYDASVGFTAVPGLIVSRGLAEG